MCDVIRKDDFIKKYNGLVNDEIDYIFIDIKVKRLPEIETIIIRRENFELKFRELMRMYDDNMQYIIPDDIKEKYNINEPIKKIVNIYSEYHCNFREG